MQVAFALLIVATTVWVAFDASQRDWSGHRFADATWKWVAGMLLLWVVTLPVYVIQRGRVPAKR